MEVWGYRALEPSLGWLWWYGLVCVCLDLRCIILGLVVPGYMLFGGVDDCELYPYRHIFLARIPPTPIPPGRGIEWAIVAEQGRKT